MTVQQPTPREYVAEAETAPAEQVVLPVIVMDETVLLPHMSLPLPIEDEEAGGAITAATNADRQVLLLTERPLPPTRRRRTPARRRSSSSARSA